MFFFFKLLVKRRPWWAHWSRERTDVSFDGIKFGNCRGFPGLYLILSFFLSTSVAFLVLFFVMNRIAERILTLWLAIHANLLGLKLESDFFFFTISHTSQNCLFGIAKHLKRKKNAIYALIVSFDVRKANRKKCFGYSGGWTQFQLSLALNWRRAAVVFVILQVQKTAWIEPKEKTEDKKQKENKMSVSREQTWSSINGSYTYKKCSKSNTSLILHVKNNFIFFEVIIMWFYLPCDVTPHL